MEKGRGHDILSMASKRIRENPKLIEARADSPQKLSAYSPWYNQDSILEKLKTDEFPMYKEPQKQQRCKVLF